MPVDLSTRGTQELNVTVVTMFDRGVNNAAQMMSDVLTVFGREPSDSEENVYFWGDSDFSLTTMVKGTDKIEFEGVNVFESRIGNVYLARGIGINIWDYQNDKIGRYREVFRKAGLKVGLHPSRAAEDTILASNTLLCYDGKALCATNHPSDPKNSASTPFSNNVAKATLDFTTFGEAWEAMQGFPYADGRKANAKPNYLVVSPKFRGIGMDICYGDRPSVLSGGGNPWLNQLDLLVIPELEQDPSTWYLVDTRIEGEMPLILQERAPLTLDELYADPNSPQAKEAQQMRWLITGSVVAGVGEPRRILRAHT